MNWQLAILRDLTDVQRRLGRLETHDRPGEIGALHQHHFGKIPSGSIDGTNTTFELENVPNPPSSLCLYLNGVRLREGSGYDYTLSGATITMAQAPVAGDTLIADYTTS